MILTCPECATGYFVEDDQIRAAGRAVRCAACGARWTALPERPLDLVASDAADGAVAEDPAAEPATEPGALTGDDLPRAFRTRAEEEKRMRQAAITGAIWAGVAVVAAGVIGSAIVFRESVVRAWPQTASAYAAVGLPVNPTGLAIEQVHAEPSLEEGRAALAVSGVIRNVVGREVTAPPLRISLLNAQGKRVAGQIANLANARIPPGETRHFVTSIFDPPFSAANLQVDFAIGTAAPAEHGRGGAAPAPLAPTIPLRGLAAEPAVPPVMNATPLPPGAIEPASAPPSTSSAPAAP